MLLTSEIKRVRDELGYNVLQVGAEPYISTSAIFDQVIQQYATGSTTTTSTSVVAAQLTPTVTQLVLTSATGFIVGDNVAVDEDARYEQGRIAQITGNTIWVLLMQAHGDSSNAAYPVTQEGAEMIVREKLREIAKVKQLISRAGRQAGLQQVDEVHWYPGKSGTGGPIDGLMALLAFWRDELAHTLGVVNLRSIDGSKTGGGNSTPVLY